MESFKVFILKDGPFYWDGRKWVDSPNDAKCYGTKARAETALVVAKTKAAFPAIVEGSLKV